MLEAVTSYDLWIWHAYFDPAGSNNDINVLNESDFFDDLLQDRAPEMQYTINGEKFTKGYYLADDIYPEWAILVKSFKCLMDPKTTKFKRYQEAARKDIEQAFVVLQDNGSAISDLEEDYLASDPTNMTTRTWDERVAKKMRVFAELGDIRTHHRLRNALVEHVWNLLKNYRQR
uniref:uncharacterized protein LOC122608881 n=1 Tax=Erigeron canadensis TaxID=72917 RepID=UPI001CB8C68D|nr:uncharacterized protein LOC122608881 [Erigeron canadensis]